MRYYNEVKAENAIKRKAIFLTIAVFFVLGTAAFFTFTDSGRELLPDTVKEWFKEDAAKTPPKA